MPLINQGDVFDFDFGPRGDNRQEGVRPALVIQTDLLNRVEAYSLTIVVPISRKGRPSPSHIRIEPSASNGLTDVSFAKCEQIYTVPRTALKQRRGSVDSGTLYSVKEALRNVLDL